jgi:hypothetical protein
MKMWGGCAMGSSPTKNEHGSEFRFQKLSTSNLPSGVWKRRYWREIDRLLLNSSVDVERQKALLFAILEKWLSALNSDGNNFESWTDVPREVFERAE